MHDWGMMNWGWGGMVFQLLFWLFIIIAIAWAIRFFTRQNQRNLSAKEETALDILKKRYARGEIDYDEYENIKKRLV